AGKHGRIIFVASTAARVGFNYTSAYCASKHAVLGMARSLAMEIAPKGVTVNCVCPGWTDTDMAHAAVARIVATTGRSEADARGELLAVAGQIAWNAKNELCPGGFAAQFEQALTNVVAVVAAADGVPMNIVSLTIYVTDREQYVAELPAVGEAYRRVMGGHYP